MTPTKKLFVSGVAYRTQAGTQLGDAELEAFFAAAGTVTSAKIIKDRDIFFSSKDLNIIGKEAKPLAEKFVNKYRQVSNLIKGVIANKGIARGKARVLVVDFGNFNLVSNAVKEMQEGEILVAETTAPEIIQACHKAAAIITNQGGMLSHAAIISRELNIPCIIGTDKEVTVNIKTGDEIEVDANEGVVRIIK
jgi:pyruvate,water dikinase